MATNSLLYLENFDHRGGSGSELQRELQQAACNHLSDINYDDFINIYREHPCESYCFVKQWYCSSIRSSIMFPKESYW